jgi:DNA-binding transcriptional MerR regulator
MLKISEEYKKLKTLLKIDIPLEKIKEYMKLSPENKLKFLEEINELNYLVYTKMQERADFNSSKDETS